MTRILTGTEHHALRRSTTSMRRNRASQNYAEKDYAHVAHQALIAYGHTQRAVRHGNEATRYHVEQHGNESA